MSAQSRKWRNSSSRTPKGGIIILILLALLPGCAVREAGTPAHRGATLTATSHLAPFTIRRIPLLNSPMDIRLDYVYPEMRMRQKLVWEDGHHLWRMTFPTRYYAYAGVIFRNTVDVSDRIELTKLAFRIRPARLANHLTIALVDESSAPGSGPTLTDCLLHELGPFENDGWAQIEIPLTRFPATALPVGQGLAQELSSRPARPFDWSRVREIRFISNGGRIPAQEIQVKNVRFQR